MVLIYDGSYDGLLCAVFEIYDKRLLNSASIISGERRCIPFCECREVENKTAYADRVEKKLKSFDADMTVYRAWLSKEDGIEDCILHFIKTALETGKNPSGMLYDAEIKRTVFAARRVGSEAHRYLQFTRFVSTGFGEGGCVYVADIEPQYDILPMIAEHFTKRFSDQRFLIRDKKHAATLVWDTKSWYITQMPELLEPALPCDGEHEALWRDYFKTVAIPWRVNK